MKILEIFWDSYNFEGQTLIEWNNIHQEHCSVVCGECLGFSRRGMNPHGIELKFI